MRRQISSNSRTKRCYSNILLDISSYGIGVHCALSHLHSNIVCSLLTMGMAIGWLVVACVNGWFLSFALC